MTALALPPRAPVVAQPPVALLIEPSPDVRAGVTDVLAPHGYHIRVAEGITDGVDQATLVLVEADRSWRALGLIRRIHDLRPELLIAGVRPWWDEDEADLTRIARFVLHVPLRDDQLQGLAALAMTALASSNSQAGHAYSAIQ